jgi:MinD-like ATPase involved in chromosome partitioning or flagellar assembly
MAESADHAIRVYERFNEIMNTFQDYSLPYLGGIERDKAVSNAIQQQLPLFKSHQNTASKLALIKLAEQTILLDGTRASRVNKNIV